MQVVFEETYCFDVHRSLTSYYHPVLSIITCVFFYSNSNRYTIADMMEEGNTGRLPALAKIAFAGFTGKEYIINPLIGHELQKAIAGQIFQQNVPKVAKIAINGVKGSVLKRLRKKT